MKLISIICTVLWLQSASGQIVVAPAPLEARLDGADVVCACVVLGSVGGNQRTGSLQNPQVYRAAALRAYKGAKNGELLQVFTNGTQIKLVDGGRYILLLSRRPNGTGPILQEALPIPVDFPGPMTPASYNTVQGEMDEYLTSKFHSTNDTNVKDATAIVHLLDQYKTLSPTSEEVLLGMSTTQNDEMAILSSCILLARNLDADRLFPLLLSRLQHPLTGEYIETDSLSSIFSQNAQASEIGDFENLADSRDLEVRHAALRALRKVAAPSTTAFLIKELDASDSISQYTALATLAEIQHKSGEYGPGLGEFEQDKDKYIRLWKQWFHDSTK